MELWNAPTVLNEQLRNKKSKERRILGRSPKIAQIRRGSLLKKVIKDRIRAPKWGGGGGLMGVGEPNTEKITFLAI